MVKLVLIVLIMRLAISTEMLHSVSVVTGKRLHRHPGRKHVRSAEVSSTTNAPKHWHFGSGEYNHPNGSTTFTPIILMDATSLAQKKDDVTEATIPKSSITQIEPITPTTGPSATTADINSLRMHSVMGSSRSMRVATSINAIRNREVRVVLQEKPPFIFPPDYTGVRRGIIIDILGEFARRYNLRYNYTILKKGGSGELLPNGSWSGGIGMLERKEADILASAAIIRQDRWHVVSYTTPFSDSANAVLVRQPGKFYFDFIYDGMAIILRPFAWITWVLLIVFIISSGLLLALWTRIMRSRGEIHLATSDAVWVMYSILCCQSITSSNVPRTLACRLVLIIWWLAMITILGLFTGNMVALFSVYRLSLPFDTTQEFYEAVRDDGYKVVLIKKTSRTWISLMEYSHDDYVQLLWRELNRRNAIIYVNTLKEGVKLVQEREKLALMAGRSTLMTVSDYNCKVTAIPIGFVKTLHGIVLQQHSIFREALSEITSKFSESGLPLKWEREFYVMQHPKSWEKLKCIFSQEARALSHSIPLKKTQGAFYLVALGGFLGALWLWREIIGQKVQDLYRRTQWTWICRAGTWTLCHDATTRQQKPSTWWPWKGKFENRNNRIKDVVAVTAPGISSMTGRFEVKTGQAQYRILEKSFKSSGFLKAANKTCPLSRDLGIGDMELIEGSYIPRKRLYWRPISRYPDLLDFEEHRQQSRQRYHGQNHANVLSYTGAIGTGDFKS